MTCPVCYVFKACFPRSVEYVRGDTAQGHAGVLADLVWLVPEGSLLSLELPYKISSWVC